MVVILFLEKELCFTHLGLVNLLNFFLVIFLEMVFIKIIIEDYARNKAHIYVPNISTHCTKTPLGYFKNDCPLRTNLFTL